MTWAIDYAKVDGDAQPDCVAARAMGASIAYIRGAWEYRGRSSVDLTLMRDAPAWRGAGVRVGAYAFLDYEGSPELLADALASSYARQASDMPVALDLEMDEVPPGTTAAGRVAIAERALAELQKHYGARGVIVYTSLQQWEDHFGDLPSEKLGACPLWLKTPYAWNPRNQPHLESVGPLGALPRPWRAAGSPGAWLQQFQGDALGWAGMTSTVDLSKFLAFDDQTPDARAMWVKSVTGNVTLDAWQRGLGLAPDGIVGPATFCQLCR